jgi:hypothetical protein
MVYQNIYLEVKMILLFYLVLLILPMFKSNQGFKKNASRLLFQYCFPVAAFLIGNSKSLRKIEFSYFLTRKLILTAGA